VSEEALPFVPERLREVEGGKHFKAEMALLEDEDVAAYYRHVLADVELDRSNPQNSYVMWACGKVDALDRTKGSKAKDARVSLPDIDNDFPVGRRDEIVAYIRQKYGDDRVAQMATFSRIQGRGAIKEVLRVHGRCGFEEMNRITAGIPDEAAIADELQEMAEAGEEPSIIR